MATTTKKADSKYYEAVGRRKEATARVRITESKKSEFIINERDLHTYFPTEEMQRVVKSSFALLPDIHYSVSVRVKSGGVHAQAEAVSLGLARAIQKADQSYRPSLKKAMLLTRNPREKERRKFGLKKARKSPQWSKR